MGSVGGNLKGFGARLRRGTLDADRIPNTAPSVFPDADVIFILDVLHVPGS